MINKGDTDSRGGDVLLEKLSRYNTNIIYLLRKK